MVDVGPYCIDRYETASVDRSTGQALSPFYPPERRWYTYVFETWDVLRGRVGPAQARGMALPALSAWQREHEPTPMAVSRPGMVPQGYHSYYSARRACEAAGKRLCSSAEWERACRGEADHQFPYGATYRVGPCNVGRPYHPAALLHGLSSSGHLDPRLNLLQLEGDAPVLRVSGASQACASRWGNDAAYDMVGNLDEWVDEPEGVFRGGFYARRTYEGCAAQIATHGPTYFDYSTGVRCCRDAVAP